MARDRVRFMVVLTLYFLVTVRTSNVNDHRDEHHVQRGTGVDLLI